MILWELFLGRLLCQPSLIVAKILDAGFLKVSDGKWVYFEREVYLFAGRMYITTYLEKNVPKISFQLKQAFESICHSTLHHLFKIL